MATSGKFYLALRLPASELASRQVKKPCPPALSQAGSLSRLSRDRLRLPAIEDAEQAGFLPRSK